MERSTEGWREAALSLLLQRMSTCARARPVREFDESLSTAAVGQSILLSHVEDISALSALAPRAAEGAVSLLDNALSRSSRADLFDDSAQRRARPRLLAQAVSVVFAEPDGRCLVKVRSSGPASRQGGGTPDHIVLISGVHLERDAEAPDNSVLCIESSDGDDAAGGRPYFNCTCRAFEYKHAGEVFCKHVFAAGIAIASNLASYKFTPDEEVVAMLALPTPGVPPTGTGTGDAT